MSEIITEVNYQMLAARHYDGSSLSVKEFVDDLKRLKYLKRIFNKYRETGTIKHRLALNHIIILCNVFGQFIAISLMFLKLEEYLDLIRPFLEVLGYWPSRPIAVGKKVRIIDPNTIIPDEYLIQSLKLDLSNGKH